MVAPDTLLLIVLGVLAFANAIVSFLVLRSHYYSVPQKAIQCLFVWLLPVIGAVGIWAFLRTQEEGDLFDTRANIERREKMIVSEVDTAIREVGGHAGDV